MKIGRLSDTHDGIDNVKEAIYRFKEQKVELIIHAGDFVFPGIIDGIKASQNEDWGKAHLIKKICGDGR
jgi:predicted phosphodiesterase